MGPGPDFLATLATAWTELPYGPPLPPVLQASTSIIEKGDATEALQTLEDRLLGADVMVISCARLIRIDFSAAGTLLNWVTARQAEGRQVQFSEVHRLVAAFFNVIGINEHARVLPRPV